MTLLYMTLKFTADTEIVRLTYLTDQKAGVNGHVPGTRRMHGDINLSTII